MRLSTLIRKVEDKTLTHAPRAKDAALRTTSKAAGWLGTKLTKLAERSAPKTPEAQG